MLCHAGETILWSMCHSLTKITASQFKICHVKNTTLQNFIQYITPLLSICIINADNFSGTCKQKTVFTLSTVCSVPRKAIKYVQGELKNKSKWEMVMNSKIYTNSSTSKDSVFCDMIMYTGLHVPWHFERTSHLHLPAVKGKSLNPWKMKVTCSFKMLRPTYPLTQCHVRKDQNP